MSHLLPCSSIDNSTVFCIGLANMYYIPIWDFIRKKTNPVGKMSQHTVPTLLAIQALHAWDHKVLVTKIWPVHDYFQAFHTTFLGHYVRPSHVFDFVQWVQGYSHFFFFFQFVVSYCVCVPIFSFICCHYQFFCEIYFKI